MNREGGGQGVFCTQRNLLVGTAMLFVGPVQNENAGSLLPILSRISRQQQQSIKLSVRAFYAGALYACTGRPPMKPAPSAWMRCLFSPTPSHPSFHVRPYKSNTLKLAADASEP